MKSTSTAGPNDRLSTLPVEILSEIFKLAYTPASPPTGPICRALLPFDRSIRFRRLEVKSVEKLRKLAEMVEKGAMGAYARELKLEEVDGESAPGLKDRQLKSFFANLPHLSHLELGKGCQLTLRLILSNSLARASLRNLIHLATEAVEGKNPFDPTLYRLLSSYPALRSLSITSEIPWHELVRVKFTKKRIDPLPNIRELTITSQGADLPLLAHLVAACPSLDSLSLDTPASPAEYPGLLPLLPAQLKRLELKAPRSHPNDPHQPCDTHLGRFQNLEHLYLGDDLFHPNILDLVRTFPRLTSLGFGPWDVVDCKDLLALVDGPTRFTQLKTLILDTVRGEIGWRVGADGDGDLHPDADPENWYVGPGWVVPAFTFDDGRFYEKDVEQLVKRAALNGVKVEGTTVPALEVIAKYDNEIVCCLELRAFETGDFSELRRMTGDEYVDELLFELDPGCECGDCW